MSREMEIEVYTQLRNAQEKYSYFFLAAIGAAIGFALTQTNGLKLSISQLPLAFALLSWGISFFLGCLHLQYVNSNLYANFELLRVQSGKHPNAGNNQQVIQAASEGIRQAIQHNDKYLMRYSSYQFKLFFAGAFFYVAWHIFEMYLRLIS